MKILIRNLPRTVTEAELRTMFDALGTVQSCTLVMDKKTGDSKGFGFVEMPKAGEAKAAIKLLNGKVVGDLKIRVKKAEDRPATPSKRTEEIEAANMEGAKLEEISSVEQGEEIEEFQGKSESSLNKHNPYGKIKG